jgi:hypothetical protein
MKKFKTERKDSKNDFNKEIRKALSCGEIISFIARRENGDLFVKYTRTTLNDYPYYGIWERDLLEGKWHLLQFGGIKEVEPEWNDFIGFWSKQGENISRMVA